MLGLRCVGPGLGDGGLYASCADPAAIAPSYVPNWRLSQLVFKTSLEPRDLSCVYPPERKAVAQSPFPRAEPHVSSLTQPHPPPDLQDPCFRRPFLAVLAAGRAAPRRASNPASGPAAQAGSAPPIGHRGGKHAAAAPQMGGHMAGTAKRGSGRGSCWWIGSWCQFILLVGALERR